MVFALNTWSSYVSGTNGNTAAISYRLAIEGFKYEFVTTSDMVTHSYGYERRLGLKRDGLRIAYNTDIVNAVLQGSPITFNLQGNAEVLEAFAGPTKSSTLTYTMGETDTTIEVGSIVDWAEHDDAYCGTEMWKVLATTHVGGLPVFLTLRGSSVGNSIPRAHYVSADFVAYQNPAITDRPHSLLKRRAMLYAYGPQDNPIDSGSLIWRGVISSDVGQKDNLDLTLQAQPITELLRSNVGSAVGEMTARGIYHPSALPLCVWVGLKGDSLIVSGVFSATASAAVYGYYNTKEEMAAVLNAQLAVSCSGWATLPTVGFAADDTMGLYFQTGAGGLAVYGGFVGGLRQIPPGETGWRTIPEESSDFTDAVAFSRATSIGDISLYGASGFPFAFPSVPVVARRLAVAASHGPGGAGIEWTDLGGTSAVVPNARYVFQCRAPYPNVLNQVWHDTSPLSPLVSSLLNNTFPGNKVYLNSPDNLPSNINEITTATTDDPPHTLTFLNPVFDNTEQSFTATWEYLAGHETPSGLRAGLNSSFIIRNDSHKFKVGTLLVEAGSVVDFLRVITQQAAQYSPLGMTPPIFPEDVDLAEISASLAGVIQSPYVTQRRYGWAGTPHKLEEYLAEEFKLIGSVPSVTADGRISMQRLRFASTNELATVSLGGSQVLTDKGWPTFARTPQGTRNVVKLLTGYDPEEDEHKGDTITAKFVQSIQAMGGLEQVLSIAPYSNVTVEIARSEVENILLRPVSLLGLNYQMITFEIPLMYYTRVQLGKIVSLTNTAVPNFLSGTRGVQGLIGVVIGVDWDLATGRGRINLLTSGQTFRGYTPSLALHTKVTTISPSVASLQVSASAYSPPGTTDLQYWNVGDAIRIEQFNTWNPLFQEGTVSALDLTANTMQVTFPSAFDSSIVKIGSRGRFLNSTGSAVTPTQATWAHIGSGSHVGFGAAANVPVSYFSG